MAQGKTRRFSGRVDFRGSVHAYAAVGLFGRHPCAVSCRKWFGGRVLRPKHVQVRQAFARQESSCCARRSERCWGWLPLLGACGGVFVSWKKRVRSERCAECCRKCCARRVACTCLRWHTVSARSSSAACSVAAVHELCAAQGAARLVWNFRAPSTSDFGRAWCAFCAGTWICCTLRACWQCARR